MRADRSLVRQALDRLQEWRLTAEARAERRRDARGLPAEDPGIERVLIEAVAWLARGQDRSGTGDGGVAHHYSLLSGWSSSYPETTGFIVPTMLAWAEARSDQNVAWRARRMLDWLVSIQLPTGGFQGGAIGVEPVPVTFNTGQILLGLAAGVRVFGAPYVEAMRRAADWLVSIQDPDGAWRRHLTPYASRGEKTYEMHTAWGLLEAAQAGTEPRWAEAALRNVNWALGHQRTNGWFDRCCLTDQSSPLTHTLGYALRGIVEAWRFGRDERHLAAATRLADALASRLGADGFLAGRLRADWSPAARWACLTGSAQIACCWFILHDATGHRGFLEAARRATSYVRRTVAVTGDEGRRGGVKGSFPIYGDYGTWQYVSWAGKFLVDALMLESQAGARPPVVAGLP